MQALHNTSGKLFMQIRHLARHLALGLALATPVFAQASYSINNSVFSCSAGLSFANSEGLDAHCTGNFSVTGGTWTSDTKIALSADGSLTLDGVAMTAPIIELLSPQIWVNASLDTSGGTVQLEARGDVTIDTRPDRQTPRSVSGSGAGTVSISAGIDITTRLQSSENIALESGLQTIPNSASQLPTLRLVGGDISLSQPTGPGSTNQLYLASDYEFSSGLGTVYLVDQTQVQLNWTAAVPEPETYTLALAALAILGSSATLARRRQA
jgi:hypothetical protein